MMWVATIVFLFLFNLVASYVYLPLSIRRPAPPLLMRSTADETISEENDIRVTWEPGIAQMIRDRVAARHRQRREEPLRPFMVAVAGIPGCGKSTSSSMLADMLLKSDGKQQLSTMVMPFDGYHYSMETLQTFENAQDAIYRRGAPDTFDALTLQQDLERIRHGTEKTVKIPGFDHAKGNPEPAAHIFRRGAHEVVICEGLYLLHDEGDWKRVLDSFDLSVFVSADIDICVERLKERNKCIPGYTAEEIEIRCEVVDRNNAITVQRSQKRADITVTSAAS